MGKVTLINGENGQEYEFDIIETTRGAKAIDFSSLMERTGMFSYDPGYGSTAACKSEDRKSVV